MRSSWCALCETETARTPYYFKPPDSQFAQRIDVLPSLPQRWLLTKCSECGVVSADPLPSPEELISLYNEFYYGGAIREDFIGGWMMHKSIEPRTRAWPWSRWSHQRAHNKNLQHLRRLADFIPNRKKIDFLDLGCGTGEILAAAADLGWNGVGVEVSHDAASRAKERSGMHVIRSTCDEINFSSETFDIIHMSEVLEHVSTAGRFLRRAAQWLRPAGVMFISVPNDLAGYRSKIFSQTWWIFPPVHLHYFTIPSLLSVLSRADLQLVAKGSLADAISVDLRRYLGWRFGLLRSVERIQTNRLFSLLLKCLQVGWDHILFFPIKWALNRSSLGYTFWLIVRKPETRSF